MSKHFLADFYVTCATVIPVLFLAVAVQGAAYRWFLDLARERRRQRKSLAKVTFWVLVGLAMVILVEGGFGDGLAIYALYRGSDWWWLRLVVLVATLGLLFAVIAGSFVAGVRTLGGGGTPPPTTAEGPAADRTTKDND